MKEKPQRVSDCTEMTPGLMKKSLESERSSREMQYTCYFCFHSSHNYS